MAADTQRLIGERTWTKSGASSVANATTQNWRWPSGGYCVQHARARAPTALTVQSFRLRFERVTDTRTRCEAKRPIYAGRDGPTRVPRCFCVHLQWAARDDRRRHQHQARPGHLCRRVRSRRPALALACPSVRSAVRLHASCAYSYLLTLALVLITYRLAAGSTHKRRYSVPAWALVLLVASKRMHSLYVLRLFNDCFAMLFAHAAGV